MNVTITPAAERFIRRMLRLGGSPGSGLRLRLSPGGCTGLAAEFDVEAAARQGDTVLDHNGMKLFLPAESRQLLEGVTMDFAETALQSGLIFHDPKAVCSNCSSSPTIVSVESLLGRH